MGPMVGQLESRYAGKAEVERIEIDELAPGTPAFARFRRLAELSDFRVTPTLLVVDGRGQVRGRYEGYTSYWTLSRDLEAILAEKSPPPP